MRAKFRSTRSARSSAISLWSILTALSRLRRACRLPSTERKTESKKTSSRFFYIDAPNGSPDSTEVGGTSDIGAGLEKRSNPYYQWGASVYSTPDPKLVEYAILDGEENADFYMGGLHRSLNRFSRRFTENLFAGSLSCTRQAVTSADKTIDAAVKLTVNSGIEKYVDEIPDVTLTVKMTDPLTGNELYSVSESMGTLTADEEAEKHIELQSSDIADGLNSAVGCIPVL